MLYIRRSYLIERVVVFGKVENVKQFDGLFQVLMVVFVEDVTAWQETLIVRVDEFFHGVRVLQFTTE